MNFFDILMTTLTNSNINTAIIASLGIILLGFFCRKKGIFNDQTGKILTNVVLSVSLPALAFRSFLAPIKPETFEQGMNVLIWGIAMYVVLILVSKPLFIQFKGDQQTTMRVLSIFGSTTFFGIPIVTAIYGPEGTLYASIFNIGYRIFLYSYAYVKMSGLKMSKDNVKTMFLNPIVIATFLGLFLWIFQANMPQVTVEVANASGELVPTSLSIFRFDQTAPQLYSILTYLANLCSPLAWLAIGATLGAVDFKQAMTDKATWYYTFVKTVIIPAINVAILAVLALTGILPVSIVALGTIVIMMATPPATVAVAYAISFDKDAVLSSNASLLGTVGAIVMTPIWIVLIEMIASLGIF